MITTRRDFVTRAVALPIALAGLSSSRLAALAQAGLAAEQAELDLGTYQIGASADGVLALIVRLANGEQFLRREKLTVLWHPTGAATLTLDSYDDKRVRTRDLDPATAAAIFSIFTEPRDGER